MQEIQETCVQSLGQEDSPEGGNGNSLQYSCLENFMDRGAWRATIHSITISRRWLSDYVCSCWRHPNCFLVFLSRLLCMGLNLRLFLPLPMDRTTSDIFLCFSLSTSYFSSLLIMRWWWWRRLSHKDSPWSSQLSPLCLPWLSLPPPPPHLCLVSPFSLSTAEWLAHGCMVK